MLRLPLTPIFTGLAGLLMVGFGSWIMAAEVARAPAVGPIGKLERGEQPDERALTLAESALVNAIEIRADPDYLSELGLVRFARWENQSPAERNPAQLQRAIATLENALAASPANPYGWTQLAMSRYLAGADIADIGDALELAVLTGPNFVWLHQARAELALRLWPDAGPEQPRWAEQILRRAFHAQPKQIFELAKNSGTVDTLRKALADDSAALQQLDGLLGRKQ